MKNHFEFNFPKLLFNQELSAWSRRRNCADDEADLSEAVSIEADFPDPEGLLASAVKDLKKFLQLGKVRHQAGGFPVKLRLFQATEKEVYRITTTKAGCLVESGDLEGLRRGIYYLIDEMLIAEGPFLKIGSVERYPFIKTRISRCFFGPLKRPPFYRDELMDDTDYYPEAYLSRLAREGINGLWLTIDFKTLGRTDILPVDPDVEKRLRKLREVVERCRRYGIRIYLYCCEPVAFDEDDPILLKFPELAGTSIPGKRGFCPSSEPAQEYLRQALSSIFSAVPRLGGMIVLSVGEWYTLCCNFPGHECPNCGDKEPWLPLKLSLAAMERGMRQAAPEAELISWPYTQIYYWGREKAIEAAAHLPENVRLMHNFESGGGKKQLGKMRTVSDYWLSYIGPSRFFVECSQRAQKAGTSMFAKLQVGCAWECNTTQYVPIPLNLFFKYREMLKLGVSGAMQSWYFGAYPSLMTKAAGMLAFCPFPENPDAFLLRLAQLTWGREYAPQTVEAWKLFSKAYDHYPLCIDLGYIGPVHDSVVWNLHLKPVNRRLAPSWRLDFSPPGDRIGECISNHNDYDSAFSLDEVITLTDKMIEFWDAGLDIMRRLPLCSTACRRELGVAEAVRILMAGSNAIFKFYRLREKMIFSTGIARLELLKQLREIVEEQINLSAKMLPLIAEDPSIGFHSEAEGYKFTPAMIKRRIAFLKDSLREDFPEAEKTIKSGMPLYPEYTGEKPCGKIAEAGERVELDCYGIMEETFCGSYNNFQFNIFKDNSYPRTFFEFAYDDEFLDLTLYAEKPAENDRFIIHLEAFKLTWSEYITIRRDGSVSWRARRAVPQVEIIETPEAWSAKVKIARRDIGQDREKLRPLRFNIERLFKCGKEEHTLCWAPLHPLKNIFVLGHYNPDDFGWLIPPG
jgi:hypothetical protein